MYHQHDVRWIPEGTEGAGALLVFNNDIPNKEDSMDSPFQAIAERQHPDPDIKISEVSSYSAVYLIDPPLKEDGNYELDDNMAFGPPQPDWVYAPADTLSFFSPFVSGAERLANGHMMVLSGAQGRMFEVNTGNQIVWEYWNPYYHDYRLPDGSPAQPNGPFIFAQYRIKEYPKDFEAFKDKTLTPISPQPEVFIPDPIPAKPSQKNEETTEAEEEEDMAEKYESGQ